MKAKLFGVGLFGLLLGITLGFVVRPHFDPNPEGAKSDLPEPSISGEWTKNLGPLQLTYDFFPSGKGKVFVNEGPDSFYGFNMDWALGEDGIIKITGTPLGLLSVAEAPLLSLAEFGDYVVVVDGELISSRFGHFYRKD